MGWEQAAEANGCRASSGNAENVLELDSWLRNSEQMESRGIIHFGWVNRMVREFYLKKAVAQTQMKTKKFNANKKMSPQDRDTTADPGIAPSSRILLDSGSRRPLAPVLNLRPRLATWLPGLLFLMVEAQEEEPAALCSWGWGWGPGSCAAGMEAPTLQGQADVTKAKQTPCHNGVTANSAQHTEPWPAMAASGRGGGAGSPKGNLHTEFIRPLSSFKHMLL